MMRRRSGSSSKSRPEIRVIDYYEISSQGLDQTTKVVLNKPYLYGTHYMPHDIAIREVISGISRKGHG